MNDESKNKPQYKYKPENAPFAAAIDDLIKSRDMTQKDFATALGVKRQAVSGWINSNELPGIKTILAIADYFDVSVDFLFGRNQPPPKNEYTATICKYTGLSPDAIKALRHYCKPARGQREEIRALHHNIDVINLLLENSVKAQTNVFQDIDYFLDPLDRANDFQTDLQAVFEKYGDRETAEHYLSASSLSGVTVRLQKLKAIHDKQFAVTEPKTRKGTKK